MQRNVKLQALRCTCKPPLLNDEIFYTLTSSNQENTFAPKQNNLKKSVVFMHPKKGHAIHMKVKTTMKTNIIYDLTSHTDRQIKNKTNKQT